MADRRIGGMIRIKGEEQETMRMKLSKYELPVAAMSVLIVLVATLAGTLLTRPTDESILLSFYRQVQPFGAWGPIRARSGLSPDELHDPAESAPLATVNLILSSAVILGVYLAPMYLVGHWLTEATICLAIATAAAIALYFTWYLHLPPATGQREI